MCSNRRQLILLTELWLVIVDKLSSRQLLDFIRSEGKGDLLYYLLVLRCSVCMIRCQSMPSMLYCSKDMPVGCNGLSMPTEGHSLCMPTIIINVEVRGVEQDSAPYMMKIVPTHIPIECGVVSLDVY